MKFVIGDFRANWDTLLAVKHFEFNCIVKILAKMGIKLWAQRAWKAHKAQKIQKPINSSFEPKKQLKFQVWAQLMPTLLTSHIPSLV